MSSTAHLQELRQRLGSFYAAKDQGRDRVVLAEGTLKKDRVLAPEAEITPTLPAREEKR